MILKHITRALVPVSRNEDTARREYILNILLLGAISLLGFAIVVAIVTRALSNDPVGLEQNALPLAVLWGLIALFLSLYTLSRKGYSITASYIFVGLFFALAAYLGYEWGVDVVSSLLIYALVIVMAGVLVSTRFAFVVTLVCGLTMWFVGGAQLDGSIEMSRYWRTQTWSEADTIVTIAIFLIIATVAWLSNREIEKSLRRARRSERALKKERDLLEVKVEERTQELREAQAEKLQQVYRFAEFGRISSGLFHDLINPLNAVSLNLEKVAQSAHAEADDLAQRSKAMPVSQAREYVDGAVRAAKRLEEMVVAVRSQLVSSGGQKVAFSLETTIKQVIEVLGHKARAAQVRLDFVPPQTDIELFGESVKCSQIFMNLIANAIDACAEVVGRDRVVTIEIKAGDASAIARVCDTGAGIPAPLQENIFTPFFSTKAGKGMGLGLSMVKEIVEKDFDGTIEFVSSQTGTTFTVMFPQHDA